MISKLIDLLVSGFTIFSLVVGIIMGFIILLIFKPVIAYVLFFLGFMVAIGLAAQKEY